MMKKIFISLTIAGASLLLSGCNDWLDVVPNNEQVAADYWKTKEQVEEVLAQGYSEMRTTVPSLVYWGNSEEVQFMLTRILRCRIYRTFR